ncbi:methyl-CpG-binding domain-containing protein 9 isoform X2 [Gastrolobium bilobum]|uniref:methyl-CpG-binding domain-containing protein 9 isoform X2 n=1 Tax=Gastrolobium bilobum TaxID=150636 RepID=UPI002AB284A9|nr:methyl-CpG-binding domain-containing protein 9 isoform X2 [Gastrolobium bilobum]
MIMELNDSTGGDHNNNAPPPPLQQQQQDSRSGLGIDLNEIPSPSSSFAETLPDCAVDIVRAYHENPAPPPGGPANLPRGSPPCVACGKPGGGGGSHVVCDGCERCFHLACAGIRGGGRQVANISEWVCGECVSGGVKSKRWPLGVKSKQLLDINASPPSDADGDGGGEELQDLRKHTPGDNSFGANPFGAPVTYSNFYNGSAFGFQKASGVVTHAVRVGFEDILNHTQSMSKSFEEVYMNFPLGIHSNNNTAIRIPSQSPNEIFLQALRDFISERRGVLQEGWRVEFRQSLSSSELYAVYCAPDGKIFDSVYEVACYLGLTSGYNSMESEIRNERSLPSVGGPHLCRKRKSTRTPVANGFAEKWGTLTNSNCKDLPSDCLGVECANARGNILEVAEIGRKEDDRSGPQQSADGLPLQFKDFFVLSLGKLDGRPSYYDVNLICPIGYKSCWHDKITGSLFTCEVLEGGDSGPIFRIRRCSCSKFPVPVGSTILSMSSLCQFVSQTNEGERKTIDSMDLDGDESIQMILLDPCVPTENDVLSCLASCSNEACDTHTSDVLQPVAGSVQDNTRNSSADNLGFIDGIGEILVEERSSSSAWKVISQKLVNACKDICKQKGALKLYCKHVENETCFHKWDIRNGKSNIHFTSLDKFCCSLGSVSIPDVIYAYNDLESLYEGLGKWLEQDRFGLDVEFVQEVLEHQPGFQDSLQYNILNSRSNSSSLPTVENGFLEVEWRGGSKYQEEEAVQGLYRRLKNVRLTEKCIKEDRCPPPGKPICSKAPSELIGDIFQAWELLERFHEILDLKEPLSLYELEKELINPWFDGLDFLEKSERETDGSQFLSLQGADSNCRPILSPRCEAGPSGSAESSHAFIQVETEAMKEAAQVKLASFTYARCFGVALTKAHNSLLRVLIGELQSRVAALVDPNSEPGETRTRRGRRKDIDCAFPAKRTKLNMLPINELTWPELARRYVLAFLSMDGNLESAEITARESGKVFRCLRGDGGLLCGSLTGVAGMEADALLLAEATKKIFGSLSRENDALTMEEEESDAKGASEKILGNDGIIPEWAQVLEPVRKLPTNVGTRIRKCVYEALEKNPPEWAKKILEHSISKEVYKGNASGPTKKAVLSVLANVNGEGSQQNPNKGRKKKIVVSISDIIMKQCRIVLRRAAAADDSKVFCNLLGRKLINFSDNDDEGLLGPPAMVARPLDFRTVDLRLAAGSYGGSHEAFLEDVRELWNNVRVAFGDQPDLVELAEKLSQNFESLYNDEVVTHAQKFVEYAKLGCLSAEMRKEVHDFIVSTSEIPKAPWDEGVCKVCGIDRDDDSVLLCDTCDAEYHTYCLNPPLARIPEGNWYCPSCVDGKHATQDVTERIQIIGKHKSKKFQGEVNSLYLEALTHLSAVLEEKEYWEFSVGERTFLIKFLSDELLNSSLLRQHLEQCAELSVELHQKLRALSVEWKSLKTKEDILSTKAAKIDTFSLNTAGEVGLKEGFTALFSNSGKCLGQPQTVVDNPSNFGVFVDSLPSEVTAKEKYRFNSVDKTVPVTNSDSDSQNLNSIDLEGQLGSASVAVESQCTDRSPKSFASPNHLHEEINGSGGAAHIQVNQQKCEGRDISTLVTYQQEQCVPVDVPQIAMNESEPFHLELSAVKRNISLLQDSITSVGSQLLKLSVRREYLGIDSIGRLYWASAMPRGRSRIVVDASAALLHGKGREVSRDTVEKFPVLQRCALSDKDNCKMLGVTKDSSSLMSQPSDALGICSPWIAYETDAEIEEILCWLNDNDPKERELKDSIMLGPKSRFQEFINAQTEVQAEDQGPISMPGNSEKTLSNSLVTKATSLLEKKYGSFFEWDTIEVLKKRSKKARTTNDEKMYRCECLEPIWPCRKHCMYCHKTFSSDVELEGHNDGKCNAGLMMTLEKNKDKNGSSKGKGNSKCDTSHGKFKGGAETAGSSINENYKRCSRLIKFSNEESTCPFNFEDICSKFVTNDSNKELVREIGLIGSDGIPSFVPSISPFVSEYTLFSAQKDDSIDGGASKASESRVFQGSNDGAGICHDLKSSISPGRLAANESNKAGQSNKSSLGEQRDGKFSFCSPASDMVVDGCCVVPSSSLRPLVGKVSHILRQLKINLLDMDAALPKVVLRPSRAQLDRRQAWRAFVKSAETIYEMVQATITLEDMIKTEYLRNDWWYWSSFSAAAKSSTLPSLALRIYSLDSAIIYEKMPNSSFTDSSEPSAIAEQKQLITVDAEKSKASRKSNRKRREPDG